jgi:hypothetical protein
MSAKETATDVFSAIAAAGNIILFASQIPLILRLVRVDKDSTRYDWLPSLTLMTTMSLWCGYTVWVLPTAQLFAANFTGIALPAIYLTCFAIYAKSTRRRLTIIASGLVALAVTWGFSAGVYAGGVANATNIGGGVTAAVNCSFFVSPLRQIFRAVKELDLSRVPTLLSIVQFWQSLAWIVAAALLEDWFILGVNSAGFCFACLQLSVIFYVRKERGRRGMGVGEGGGDGDAKGKGGAGLESPLPVSSASPSAVAPAAEMPAASGASPTGETPLVSADGGADGGGDSSSTSPV